MTMGDTHSKPMSLGNLSEEDVKKIRKKFHLKEGNNKISTLDFIYGYPCILRPYVALILPSLHELFKKKGKSSTEKTTATTYFGINQAFSMFFKKTPKNFKREISLQDIISILSYLITGKTKIIINILCTSFLTYRRRTNTNNTDEMNELDRQAMDEEEQQQYQQQEQHQNYNVFEKREVTTADDKENIQFQDTYNKETNDNINQTQRNNKEEKNGNSIVGNDIERKRKRLLKKKTNPVKTKTVLSDSNIEEVNKNRKKERSFKLLKDNVYLMDKQVVNYAITKNCNVHNLIEMEESLHHLFTYMYIEQLYLLCPDNKLFQLSSKKANSQEKDKIFTKSKTGLCKEFLLKRKNSWDMTFFFPDLYCSLETDLDFRNILSGFQLYVSSKETSKSSLYCLAVDYLSSTFSNIAVNYSEATFKHFTDAENVVDSATKERLINESETGSGAVNDTETVLAIESEEKTGAEIDDICFTSFELIHSIYTNMKKNELKNMKSTEEALSKKKFEDSYTRSSSIIEIQSKSNGWRGLFLNKTSKILTDEIVFALRQCSSCFTNNEWYRLYASWKQGTSFNRFISSFLYYPSPIVIVIKTYDHQILGGVSTTPIKDTHLYHGSPEDFLFSAYPIFRIIRTNGLGSNYVYLNSKNSFYPKGLGFGGKTECFRFFLSDEFKDSYCTHSDYTYEGGRLHFPTSKRKENTLHKTESKSDDSNALNEKVASNAEQYTNDMEQNKTEKTSNAISSNNSNNNSNNNNKSHNEYNSSNKKKDKFYDENDEEDEVDAFLCKLHISEVEVWGCGDTSALEEQRILLQNEETCKSERRSVDKSKIVQNSFDKEFLLPKMFVCKMEEMAMDT